MHIVFAGGGVKAWCYLGAIIELFKNIDYSRLKSVSGTSSGSIIAFFCSLRLDFKLMYKFMIEGYKKYMPINGYDDIEQCLDNFAFDSGEHLKSWIIDILSFLGFSKSLRFDNWPSYAARLRICAFNVTKCKTVIWDTHDPNGPPSIDLVTAIIASCSIPGVFPGINFDNDIYLDAGMVCNIPVIPGSIGFTTRNINENTSVIDNDIFSWMTYLAYCFSVVNEENFVLTLPKDSCNLIRINIPNIEMLKSDFKKKDILYMIKLGSETVHHYLNNHLLQFQKFNNISNPFTIKHVALKS